MHRILLADDSPHAQRMGERILRDEGYEVVSVTDGETALLRLADVDPDVILADVFLPGRSGLEVCRHVRKHPDHSHVRVVLTAGLLEAFDEDEARAAGADAIIKKPFEASVVLGTLKPMVEEARLARAMPGAPQRPVVLDAAEFAALEIPAAATPSSTTGISDEERVRAAVTVALDAAFLSLVDEITARVLTARRD